MLGERTASLALIFVPIVNATKKSKKAIYSNLNKSTKTKIYAKSISLAYPFETTLSPPCKTNKASVVVVKLQYPKALVSANLKVC